MMLAESPIGSTSRRDPPAVATVGTRMSCPAITVEIDLSSGEIERVLETHGISSVPVVDHNRALAGIVSATDLVALPLGDTWRASEMMSSPVLVAHPEEELDRAAWRMVAGRVHCIVVTDHHDHVMGVLSARDILEAVVHRPIEDPIATVMTTPVESIGIDDTIDAALARLASANVHGLVVVDGLAPVGVFSHVEALASRRLAPALRSRPVEEMMSNETLCLNVATPIRRAAAEMVARKARRILVVQSRHLVGILSPIDLVGVLTRASAS